MDRVSDARTRLELRVMSEANAQIVTPVRAIERFTYAMHRRHSCRSVNIRPEPRRPPMEALHFCNCIAENVDRGGESVLGIDGFLVDCLQDWLSSFGVEGLSVGRVRLADLRLGEKGWQRAPLEGVEVLAVIHATT